MPANADEIALGVIVALPAEAAALAAVRMGGNAVIVSGFGCERASDAATRMLELGARALLSWGVCGGLSPQLRSGDLLLPRRVVSDAGEWITDDKWRRYLRCALADAREIESLYCSDAPILSVDEKRARALRGFEGVDMESAGVARAAARARVPFVAVKAVCDTASRMVPEIAARMLDPDGSLRANAIAGAVRGGPRMWRELYALRRDFTAALASLRRAAQALSSMAELRAS